MNIARDRLSMLCSRPEHEWDLAEAALLVSAAEYEGLDPRDGLAILDILARDAAPHLPSSGPRERGIALAGFLHAAAWFDGNAEQYDDPRNSYLSDVLERRRGLPILLSLVYCEVGARTGVPFQGVGLPGHFIVKIPEPSETFFDPFNGGRILSVEECASKVREVYGGELSFRAEMLRAVTPREFLSRILRNLKQHYTAAGDLFRAWRTTDLLVCADPQAAEAIRDRGLLGLQLHNYRGAAGDLSRYLALRPSAPDRRLVEDSLRQARVGIAALN